MGKHAPTTVEHYIDAFAKFACQRLERESWEEIETALAESWADLVDPGLPSWSEVSSIIRARCEPPPDGRLRA